MKASDLIEFLYFFKVQRVQSHTGEMAEDNLALVLQCRGAIKKSAPVYDKDGVDAKELYKGSTIIFIVRNNKKIEDTLRVMYNGKMYEIILITPNKYDNTLNVQVKRINE